MWHLASNTIFISDVTIVVFPLDSIFFIKNSISTCRMSKLILALAEINYSSH